MQLDKTEIVVRERQFWEIMDLALPMLRIHFGPIIVTMLLGVIPCCLINHLLIGWMASDEFVEYGVSDLPYRYVWDMALLVFLEAPLASVFTTVYLGKAVFLERPGLRQTIAEVARATWRLAVCHGLARGVFFAWLLLAFVSDPEWPSGSEVLLMLVGVLVLVLRTLRPFLNEIILLEQNPLIARNPQQQSIARRSERLHSGGDHVSRWLGAAWITILLVLATFHLCLFVVGFLFGEWQWTAVKAVLIVPLSMWLVATYITVVRFLNYLDTRIRQEGWEVELRMRAEAHRLAARYSAFVLIFFLVFSSLSSLSAADPVESVQRTLAGERVPWYDAKQDGIRRVTVRDNNTEDENRKSKWDAAKDIPAVAPATVSNDWGEWPSIGEIVTSLLQAIVYTFLAIVAVVLVCLLINYFLRRDASDVTSSDEGVEEFAAEGELRLDNLPFQVRRPLTDLLSAARQCYQEANYGQAIVYYFSYQLVELDRHQWIRLSRGKTNRQYLRELRVCPELASLLTRTVVPFESYFFGHHRLEREDFEACWNDLPEFQRRLERAVT